MTKSPTTAPQIQHLIESTISCPAIQQVIEEKLAKHLPEDVQFATNTYLKKILTQIASWAITVSQNDLASFAHSGNTLQAAVKYFWDNIHNQTKLNNTKNKLAKLNFQNKNKLDDSINTLIILAIEQAAGTAHNVQTESEKQAIDEKQYAADLKSALANRHTLISAAIEKALSSW